mmetsp:Transcript_13863/g.2223  ORF Transcript_13863/g.2223 Transcript_13863/m.2223 type:complete len:113 (+) Transcript_13863:113-451(+)
MFSETYGPGDIIIDEGEMSFKMYFIQHGKVNIFHKATKSSFQELGAMQYFGEISFFTENPRCASAKCLDYADLLTISRTEMDILLQKFPEANKLTEDINKLCEEEDLSSLHV